MRINPPWRRTAATALVLALAGCAAPAPKQPEPAAPNYPTAVAQPPVNGQFDYQIGGAYTPDQSVSIVDRDRHDEPVPDVYSVCYVNAFQTQPEEKAFWKRRHPGLLLQKRGKYVTDPGWPGEHLLDTSTAKKRAAIAAVVGRWVDGCAASGFQAVEPDNLDSWTRSRGRLRKAENVAYAKLLVARAHAAGLAIAQKNTGELGAAGKAKAGFDFAIAEECQVYDECADYTDAYGAEVIEIEYADNPHHFYREACDDRGPAISVILRDREVVARGRADYVYRSC